MARKGYYNDHVLDREDFDMQPVSDDTLGCDYTRFGVLLGDALNTANPMKVIVHRNGLLGMGLD